MSAEPQHVRVDLRHVRLAQSAALSEADGGVFVALDDPPPVRSVVVIHGDDGSHPLEVTRVVEVPESDPRGARGVYGRFVDDEALQRTDRVGTEHLADGASAGSPAIDDEGEAPDVSSMAMPAPVVDPDPSGPIAVAELRAVEQEGDEGDREAEEPSGNGDEPSGNGDEGGANGAPRGKRRRGRKRR